MSATTRHIGFLFGSYSRVGSVSILRVMSFDIYKRVERAFCIFGTLFNRK